MRQDARQTGLIRQAESESGKVYGYRKLADDLRDQGEHVSENRLARLASMAGIAAQVGYKRRPGRYGGKPTVLVNNTLNRQFEVAAPDRVCLSAIEGNRLSVTGDRHHLHQDPWGWLYLSVVIELLSRRVVGWSAQPVRHIIGKAPPLFLGVGRGRQPGWFKDAIEVPLVS